MPDAELDSLFPGLTDILHSADWTPSAGSILQADPEHGGVTDDSLKAFVEARMAQGIPALHELPTSGGGAATPRVASAPVIDQEPGEGEDDDEEGGPGSEPAAPLTTPEEPVESGSESPEPGAVAPGQEASPDVITIDGRQLTRDQLEAFVRFSESLDADPNLQQLLTSYYTGRFDALLQPPAAAPLAPAAPDLSQAALPTGGLDLEDPNIAALVGAIQAQQAQIAQLQQATQSVATQTMARSAQEAAALMNRAAASFQKEHELSDDDIRRLRTSASRLGVLEPLMSGIDPITQVPVRPDLLSATERALEIALYADPTYRTKMVEQAMAANRERSRKRQKLAGVGGAGSGVSRTPVAPRPGTPESKSAMLAEVAAMQAGTWQDPGA